MASDRRTGGRLEDHPDQLRAAFGRARRMDARRRTCLCSCAVDAIRVAKSSPLRHRLGARHTPDHEGVSNVSFGRAQVGASLGHCRWDSEAGCSARCSARRSHAVPSGAGQADPRLPRPSTSRPMRAGQPTPCRAPRRPAVPRRRSVSRARRSYFDASASRTSWSTSVRSVRPAIVRALPPGEMTIVVGVWVTLTPWVTLP